ncbi:RabGAP/TBC domain-containing protein [Tieghemostelium lacteum]|uniref:RabGAP/TBC domain-containing protein n=1 Tax=Tieghemostelium lacteum TaxID=361077 RepID=A0A152A8C7_TIELA|nr:RabGAP/TBC domain-containing protein [Tieghemostelium lacteum]|eukprot:KYR02448.1 RabGAP/TBC domain-containing protein [Tieghemostelium lacteum]
MMDTLVQPTQLNISTPSDNSSNISNSSSSISSNISNTSEKPIINNNNNSSSNNNIQISNISRFKKLFSEFTLTLKKSITDDDDEDNDNQKNNNNREEIVSDSKDIFKENHPNVHKKNHINNNHNYIIVNTQGNSTPSFKSKAPDIREHVNGVPKLTLIKKKEYQWLEQLHIIGTSVDCNYPQYNNNNNNIEISKLVKLGIPKRIRGYIWRLSSGSIELEKKNLGVYQHFLSKNSEEYEYKISKDISRTFPNVPYFCKEEGQSSLFNILKAYSIMDPEIGYTQGMSFIAAVLLSEMDELESFWVFTCIMKNYKLASLYSNDLGLLRQYLYVIDRLIETTMPKLFSHLKEIGITPVLFASEWISTLFTYNFDIKISKRLLDVFFIEGRFYLHRLSLSILKCYEKHLMTLEFEDAVEFLKRLGYQIDPNALLKVADSFAIPVQLIESFEAEFVHPNAPSDYF